MAKILLSYRHYPCSIGRYFKFALNELGHTVWSVGSFSNTVPWRPDRDYSSFLDIPDYETPSELFYWDAHDVLARCPFKPDALVSVDAGYYLIGANELGIPNCVILTDPHALKEHYLQSLDNYHLAFCMQQCYMPLYETTASGRKIPLAWLPYAASPKHHYWNGKDFNSRLIDVMIISGLLYNNRKAGLDAMAYVGLITYQDSGLLLEQASEAYGESVINYGWSSERDLCARFFEGLAMRNLVLTNRVPDLAHFSDLQEDVHYVAYDTVDELVDKATYYAHNRDKAWEIASRGYAAWWAGNHSWVQRMSLVLDMLLPKSDPNPESESQLIP